MAHDAPRATAYQADLHIHTLLSPCGEVEMLPSLIVECAVRAGLDIIGIADHNSCENAGAVMAAAEGSGLKVLPGMEACSLEGVHLLCLFDTLEQAQGLQCEVYRALPDVPGASRFFEQQMVVDCDDEFVSYCRRGLSLPSGLDIARIHEITSELGGIVIPSHIDRSGTGICDVLGMLPEEPVFGAVEISANITPDQARERFPSVGSTSLIMNSDAHWLSAIGARRTVFHIMRRNTAEIAMAFRGEEGRGISYA